MVLGGKGYHEIDREVLLGLEIRRAASFIKYFLARTSIVTWAIHATAMHTSTSGIICQGDGREWEAGFIFPQKASEIEIGKFFFIRI